MCHFEMPQDPLDLGWQPFVHTWISRLSSAIPESGRSYLQIMFDHSISRGLDFIRRFRQHLALPVPALSLVASLCNILSAYFDFMRQRGGGFGSPGKCNHVPNHVLVHLSL